MEFSENMILQSESGFSMPISDQENGIQILLPYGEQKNPTTGEDFFHHGVDFVTTDAPVYAMASGVVAGIGTDPVHETYMRVRHGRYEVTYGHILSPAVNYGSPVIAGQPVAKSGHFLHVGVTFDGKDLNPLDFIGMIYGNVQQLAAMGMASKPNMVEFDIEAQTKYDKDKTDMTKYLSQYFPYYFQALCTGSYSPSDQFQNSLRNTFAQAASKHYYFESIPSTSNPLGLSERSQPLVSKVLNLLLDDFVRYLGLQQGMFLPSWSEEQKKTLVRL